MVALSLASSPPLKVQIGSPVRVKETGNNC
jgi:hypothetical protein